MVLNNLDKQMINLLFFLFILLFTSCCINLASEQRRRLQIVSFHFFPRHIQIDLTVTIAIAAQKGKKINQNYIYIS